MPRRPDPPELTIARDLLRARHEAQQAAAAAAAAAAFFGAAARVAELRRDLVRLEEDQGVHAAALADTLGFDAAAQVTGWSCNRINEAQRSRRSDTCGRDAAHAVAFTDREAS
jgi:hypothetical protein